jgi:hypothetical protein
MGSIGFGEVLWLLVIVGGIAIGVRRVLAVAGRGGALAPCPLCTASISKRAVVCPNCTRDLPPGWSD